jgi:NADPH:quinone reductase-like Zn-dependent oxidoreductase
MFGLTKPRRTILGQEVAGEIEKVGKDVRRFKAGDLVFGMTGSAYGAYAEYVCMPEDGMLAVKPVNLTFEQAAAVPFGASTALYFLRDLGKIQIGQKILIIGASGCVGSYAVQLAQFFGAEVTGVCSTSNVELVKSLGADQVIDYTREHFNENGKSYHLIMDTVGKSPFSAIKKSLTGDGIYLAVAGGVPEFFRMFWTSVTGGPKLQAGMAPERSEDLVYLTGLIEAGKIRPVIDRRYPLEQTAEAHKYVDQGHKKGNVVISLSGLQ